MTTMKVIMILIISSLYLYPQSIWYPGTVYGPIEYNKFNYIDAKKYYLSSVEIISSSTLKNIFLSSSVYYTQDSIFSTMFNQINLSTTSLRNDLNELKHSTSSLFNQINLSTTSLRNDLNELKHSTSSFVKKSGDTMTGTLIVPNIRVSTITFADGTILYSTSTLGGSGGSGGGRGGTTYWSLYPAVSDVDMNGYAINSVNSIKVNTDSILFGGGLLTNVYNGSVAIGIDVYSNYNTSVGIGYSANNNYNSGVGIGAYARGNYNNSVGIGYMAQYNYDYVVSIGAQAQNNKAYSVAVGYNSRDNGFYSTTIGAQSFSNNRSVSVGYMARSNNEDAVAIGYNAVSNGRYGIAIGENATVNNGRGVAIGYNCVNNDYGTVKLAVCDTR